MKIVVDSNIIFSAILNSSGKIGHLIINGSKYFDFYTVGLLKEEIIRHQGKIIKITGFTQEQFKSTFHLFADRIKFADDILLSDKDIKDAYSLVSDIDADDTMFLSLANHLSTYLWTGDKRLINGLRNKGFKRILTTDELYDLFLHQQIKHKRSKK